MRCHETTQRLSAILVADAVGYSRLMATDEAGAVAALDQARDVLREQVLRNLGRVIDTAGDSVLAVFATAAGAVTAALEAQERMRDSKRASDASPFLPLRIGIHLGDILEKADGTVYGNGINVAARLESLAAPGCIAVSDAVREAVAGKLVANFVDLGLQSFKNIPQPMRAFGASRRPDATVPASANAGSTTTEGLPAKPSIAVLPFANLSGDPDQDFFGDGMCEDIITMLSAVPGLFVIARNSTSVFKNQPLDLRHVAQELGVRYVLQGSIRKAGARIRVTAQFVDAERGINVWAENYDRSLDDIFQLQEEVAQAIVGTLQSRFLNAEMNFISRKPPDTVGAWGLVVRAKVKLFAFRLVDLDDAEPLARKAVQTDPGYGEAHALLGHILAWRALNRWSDDWLRSARESASLCARALQLAPNDAGVLTDIGAAYWFLGRLKAAVPLLIKANELNPCSAMTCAQLGQALACVGRAEEAIPHVRRAFQISPKDPLEYLFFGNLAFAEYFAGRFEAARSSAGKALATHPDLTHVMLLYTAACVRLGMLQEARATLARVEKLGSWAVDNLFRMPRTEGPSFQEYTDAIRLVLDHEPRI